MRKLIAHAHISLDGFAAGPNGELHWDLVDEEIFNYTAQLTNQADAAIYGRVTYQIMDGYWPTAAEQPNATKHDKEHAAWYGMVEKYVLSNTVTQVKPKTTVLNGDIAAKITLLKSMPGKDIILFGSPSTAQALMRMNLVDELCLLVNPILLGKGMPYFKDIGEQKRLRLIESHVFSSGVTEVHYHILD